MMEEEYRRRELQQSNASGLKIDNGIEASLVIKTPTKWFATHCLIWIEMPALALFEGRIKASSPCTVIFSLNNFHVLVD
jgi:hypothetical protein